jgi:predicted DsbA family dithiol-disulfide isomerase
VRTDRLAREHDLAITWTHFPLHPETPPEGRELSDLFAGREAMLEAMSERLKQAMAEAGLPYSDWTRTYNSRLAQELAAWAVAEHEAGGIHLRLFRAYFAEGKNLMESAVLEEVAADVGLPTGEARRVIEERRYREAVDADWRRCRQLGLTGVPSYVAGGYAVVGAQPYEVLEELVRRARI